MMTPKDLDTTRKSQAQPGNKEVRAKIDERASERGAAMVVALLVITAFIIIAASASRTVIAISSEAEKLEQTRIEKARAEYLLSMAEATLKYDIRESYNNYQLKGKQKELQLGGSGKLPMFDPLMSESHPLLTIDGAHTGQSPATATSLYGTSVQWAEVAVGTSRNYIANKSREKFINAPEGVEIVSFKEVYRRTMSGMTEPIYAFRYNVTARAGKFGGVKREDIIQLGPAFVEDAPATVNCSELLLTAAANPSNVSWGGSANIEMSYTHADKITLYNNSGTSLYNQTVTDEATARNVSYNTGALTGPASYVSEVNRGGCQLQVPVSIGVTFNQNLSYTANGAQTVNIIEGDSIRYDWGVSNATGGYTTSWITFGSDSTQYHGNVFSNSINVPGPTQSTTSTLHVRDTRSNNGAEQTVTVNINVCRLPRVDSFSANTTTVTQGGNQNIQFNWQTQQSSQIRIVRLSDNQVIYAGNQPSGSIVIAQPQSTTQYRLEAISDCGAPTASNIVTVNVQPPACQAPSIDNFYANPANLTAGAGSNLSWGISNFVSGYITGSNGSSYTISAASGNQGIDAGWLNTPGTYTYTLVTDGCGTQRTAQVIITVNAAPPPPPPANQCGNYPAYGDLDSRAGLQGTAGFAYAGSYGSSEFRLYYRAAHYTDNRYRVNLQLYISSLQYQEFYVVNRTDYMVVIGDHLRANFDSGGVNFYKSDGTFIQHSNWGTNVYYPSGSRDFGYRTYTLQGDIFNDEGVNVPLDAFSFNTAVRTNPFVLSAATIPYDSSPSTVVNTGSSGSGGNLFSCP